MSNVEQVHEQKETIEVDVNLPGHEARTTTPLFTKTRKEAMSKYGDRCVCCNRNSEEAGSPIQWHHLYERSLANLIDWEEAKRTAFVWRDIWNRVAAYFEEHPDKPEDIIDFVDNMLVNGVALCQEHHVGKGTGIHQLPFPLWLAWGFGGPGYQFTNKEKIEHIIDERQEK